MRKFKWTAGIWLCFCFSTGCCQINHIYVLGYPRSGNHWLRFCLKDLLAASGEDSQKVFKMHCAHKPVYFEHYRKKPGEHFLIFILRNYRECMMRQHSNLDRRICSFLKSEHADYSMADNIGHCSTPNYIYNLDFYEQWASDKRFFIYYEDLMEKPREVLDKLAGFLNLQKETFDDFMQKYDQKQKQSYDNYDNPQSRAKGLLYHTSLMRKEYIFECDSFMRKNYPGHWKKYLSRFAYPEE